MERVSLFLLGGSAYTSLEIAWRGATHWTMFVAGGVSLCFLQALASRPRLPLWAGAALGATGVTGLELGIGWCCRRLLHLRVWDYSREWGNLSGLICPKYTMLWFLLCVWVLGSMRGLERVTHTRPAEL
ncbi:MAG: hypothetical protein ACI4OI_05270 [Gemmiger sp.]